jgi:hypothetical protein
MASFLRTSETQTNPWPTKRKDKQLQILNAFVMLTKNEKKYWKWLFYFDGYWGLIRILQTFHLNIQILQFWYRRELERKYTLHRVHMLHKELKSPKRYD